MTKRSKNDAEQHRHSIHLEALYHAATRIFIRSHVVLLCSAIFSRTPRRIRDNPREPLDQSSAALSGSFAPTDRLENLEIRKGFLQFPNLNLVQNPSLTTLAIESVVP